jgi:hypothetical protein
MQDEHCEDVAEKHSTDDQSDSTQYEETARAHRSEGTRVW